MISAQSGWVIALSLALGLVLQVWPLPLEWRWYRPEFTLLILFYWSLALPHRVGVISAACVGFALDLLNGIAIGSMAAGLVLSTLFILFNYQRIRQFDAIQQTVTIALLVALTLLVERWLQGLLGVGVQGLDFLQSLPMTALCWLPVRTMLRALRRYYEVS